MGREEWKKARRRDMWRRIVLSNYRRHSVSYIFPKKEDLAKFVYWMKQHGEMGFHRWVKQIPEEEKDVE